ncbi:MAG: hypothetical protein H7A23_08950 [Leptospiraceae bacterium]|nr:hypothetical protein [Leptospiraceae bacterium]MCP5494670.1 hypothetical protein [Leptospiraceae bacterium]
MNKFDEDMKELKKKSDEKWEKLKKESDERWEKLKKESDRKWEESKKESDRKWEESDRKWEESKKESDRKWEESDKRWEELKRQSELNRKESDKKYQELVRKLGIFLEDIVAPNMPTIAKEVFQMGEANFFAIRAKVKNSQGETREFDAVYIDDTAFLLNESKTNPKIEYINDFIEALENVYDYFPQYKSLKLIPVFSSFHIPDNVKKYLTKNKIYAMQMKDRTMEVINFDELKS